MQVNQPDETSYSGLSTFMKVPLALDPDELTGSDVAIAGAPMDDMVTYRPGTRFGPRTPALQLHVAPTCRLRVPPYKLFQTWSCGYFDK
jgi:arginase family enzyme